MTSRDSHDAAMAELAPKLNAHPSPLAVRLSTPAPELRATFRQVAALELAAVSGLTLAAFVPDGLEDVNRASARAQRNAVLRFARDTFGVDVRETPTAGAVNVAVLAPRSEDLTAPPVRFRSPDDYAELAERVSEGVAEGYPGLTRTPPASDLLERATERLTLTSRERLAVAHIARARAALQGSSSVGPEHIAEALSFRQPKGGRHV